METTPNPDLTKELTRLPKENELLKQERDLLKKQRPSSPRRQVDEFRVIDVNKAIMSVDRICGWMGVSPSDF